MIDLKIGKVRGTTLAAGAGAVAIVVGLGIWIASGGIRSTNDAFVDGDIVLVSAENPGRVEKIDVADNSLVREGDRLLEMDTQDLKLSLDEAIAGADAAQAQQDGLRAGAPAYSLHAAQAAVRAATAKVDRVKLAISKATVAAPIAGYVSRRAVGVGAYVQQGEPLMAIVAPAVWITANFKETEIADLKPGERADVTLDAYPGLPLHGQVESLQRASGQAFSLLPAENATGNFIKMVQRVPVKIALKSLPQGLVVGPGMSAHVRVHVG
jgi:membrane fusion protein (multidrug efflux system)